MTILKIFHNKLYIIDLQINKYKLFMYNPYVLIIGAGLLVAMSYVFEIISKKTRIPSVLFLISTGVLVSMLLKSLDINIEQGTFVALELLGIIGLIMIVLEAATDLEITRDKLGMIGKSLGISIIVLLFTSVSIALIIRYALQEPFFNALVYAIPLSVVSSAVLIPSVHSLSAKKKEFMIYESTFSDITGIMFFNFIVIQKGDILSVSGGLSLIVTIIVSIVFSYLLVVFFSRLKGGVKLFLMLAILALLYSIGKLMHMSSLLIILIFGLVMNNSRKFFMGRLKKYIDFKTTDIIGNELRLVTAESAFVVRTFFFVTFGMSIKIGMLADPTVIIIGSMIVAILYLVRYINLKLFLKTAIFPEIFLAPRGLITILLFYSIPAAYLIEDFSVGILFFVILATSLIMMAALIKSHSGAVEDLSLGGSGGESRMVIDASGPYCEIHDNDNGYEKSKCADNIRKINLNNNYDDKTE